MKRNFLLTFLLIVFMAGSVCAADLVSTDGMRNADGVYPIQVDTDGVITFAANSGMKNSYEVIITDDTLTVADSGKTFLVAPVTETTIVLPDADVGMNFRFVATDGDADGLNKMILNPQDTDFFVGVVNSTATSTFAAGDAVISPGATGDSIEVFCGTDLYWTVVTKIGTWVDDN